MKILSVGQSVQSFQGLWAERYPKTNELKYYPFLGETKEQILENTSKYKDIVKIMKELPFSAKEFLKYTKNRLAITKQKLIERYLVNKGLSAVIK